MTAANPLWTCPYCPLLCDRFSLDAGLALQGSTCTVAQGGLSHARAAAGTPQVGGQPATLDAALTAAANLLHTSRQPLLAGMGTDVAGARALHRLARASGAQTDALSGDALMQAVRSQQDRGGYTTTLAEIHERADLIVFVGSWPLARAPELLARLRRDDGTLPPLRLLGAQADGMAGVTSVAAEADVLTSLAELTAHAAGRKVHTPTPELVALAAELRAARYAVLIWEPMQLGPQGALAIERAQHLVGLLNQTTRAGGFVLGAGEGASTANQVFTWLDSLPLRTRRTALGLEHEPHLGAAERVLAGGAADLLLWVSQWQPRTPPAGWRGPTIALGLPALAAAPGFTPDVFVPLAVPGIDVAGHLFRSDGVVLLPLHAQRSSPLPTLAQVAERLATELETHA